jgi:hypothetical protein
MVCDFVSLIQMFCLRKVIFIPFGYTIGQQQTDIAYFGYNESSGDTLYVTFGEQCKSQIETKWELKRAKFRIITR